MSRCIDEGGIVHGIKCPRCGTTNSVLRRTLEDDYYNEYDKYSCHMCLWFDYKAPPVPKEATHEPTN